MKASEFLLKKDFPEPEGFEIPPYFAEPFFPSLKDLRARTESTTLEPLPPYIVQKSYKRVMT